MVDVERGSPDAGRWRRDGGQMIDLTTHTQYRDISDFARGLGAHAGSRFSN